MENLMVIQRTIPAVVAVVDEIMILVGLSKKDPSEKYPLEHLHHMLEDIFLEPLSSLAELGIDKYVTLLKNKEDEYINGVVSEALLERLYTACGRRYPGTRLGKRVKAILTNYPYMLEHSGLQRGMDQPEYMSLRQLIADLEFVVSLPTMETVLVPMYPKLPSTNSPNNTPEGVLSCLSEASFRPIGSSVSVIQETTTQQMLTMYTKKYSASDAITKIPRGFEHPELVTGMITVMRAAKLMINCKKQIANHLKLSDTLVEKLFNTAFHLKEDFLKILHVDYVVSKSLSENEDEIEKLTADLTLMKVFVELGQHLSK